MKKNLLHSTTSLRSATGSEGFSLLELLVSTGLMLIVLGAVYTLYRVQTHSTKAEADRLQAQEYANAVVDLMVREIRNAGSCSGGIIAAAKQSLQVVYDSDGDGNCNGSHENITFAFDASGCLSGYGNITRTTVVPVQSQPLTDCNVPAGAANFSFTFYPQQTSASAPPPFCFSTGDPAGCSGTLNLGAVQRISVSLLIHAMNPNNPFGGQLSSRMTSNVDLRNRGNAS